MSRNKPTDRANFVFVTKALKILDPKNAQFVIALGMSEKNEVLVMSNGRMTDNQVYQLLIEAARSIEKKRGFIIPLN